MANKGQHSYKGYEYQIEITVWCALELIFHQKKFNHIIIEPASHEDIEAVSVNEADSVCEVYNKTQNLIIQIKSRFNQSISIKDFSKILNPAKNGKRGPKPRNRPPELLRQNANSIYVLITDGVMVNKAFCVESLGEISPAESMPKSLINGESEDLTARITVLEGKQLKITFNDTLRILQEECHVPIQTSQNCYKELKECVRNRLLGKEEKEWTREQIIQVLTHNDGLPMPTQRMSIYVPPANYAEAFKLLKQHNSILIYGQPGIGKTSLGEYIISQMQQESNPYVITNSSDIDKIKEILKKPGESIIFLDDPWGKTKPSIDSVKWRDEIPKLLQDANADKKFIIVSRESVFKEIWPFEDSIPAIFNNISYLLKKENYGEEQYRLICKKVRDISLNASAWHDKQIQVYWKQLIKELPEPSGFVVALKSIFNAKEPDKIDFKELIQKCNSENLVDTYSVFIRDHSSEEIKAFFIIWALLLITPRSSSKHGFRQILKEDSFENELNHFLSWLDNYRKSGTIIPVRSVLEYLRKIDWILIDDLYGVHFYDTRTEAAFLKVMELKPDEISWVTNAFLQYLMENRHYNNALKIIENLASSRVRPPKNLLLSLEQWLLEKSLNGPIKNFSEMFKKLGYWGVSETPEIFFARAFYPSKYNKPAKPKKHSYFDSEVDFSALNEQQEILIASNVNCIELACRILETSFEGCGNFSHDGDPIIKKFNELWNNNKSVCELLSRACLIGMEKIPPEPFLLKTLIKGISLWGTEDNLQQAYNIVSQQNKKVGDWYKDWSEDEAKYLEQGVYDAEYEAHLLDTPADHFVPIEEALEEIIYSLGKTKGCSWIVEQAKDKNFMCSVLALSRMTGEEGLETALLDCQKMAENSYDFKKVYSSIGMAKCFNLKNILLEGLESDNVQKVEGSLTGLAALYEPPIFKLKVQGILSRFGFVQKLRLRTALNNFEGPIKHFTPDPWRNCIIINFNSAENELLAEIEKDLHREDINKMALALTEEKVNLLEELVKAEDLDLSGVTLVILSVLDKDKYKMLINHWKVNSDAGKRFYAYQSLTVEDDFEALKSGLNDEDYKCRRITVYKLASLMNENESLKNELIRMASTDISAPVREECAREIGNFNVDEGIESLLKLLEDKRNIMQSSFYDRASNHHVARTSTRALINFKEYSSRILPTVNHILQEGKKIQEDSFVHFLLIDLLGKWRIHKSKDYLIELLEDKWYERGDNNSCYVRRLAAAWALIFLLSEEDIPLIMEHIKIQDAEIAAPLMIAVINAEPSDFNSILEISKFRETNDKLPWLDLAVSTIFAKTEDISSVNNIASFEFLHWMQLLNNNPAFCANIPAEVIEKNLESLNKIIELLKKSHPLAVAFSFSIYQWMGEGWASILQKFNLTEKFLIQSQLPDQMSVLSTWNLIGCE